MAQSLLFDAIEAIWAEAISQALLCMEGAPGFCLPHLETHRMHYAILALWPVSAHSEKKPLLSAVRKLHLSLSLRPYQEAPKAQANARPCCGVYNSNTGPFVPRVDALRPV